MYNLKYWGQEIPGGMEIPISDPVFSIQFNWKRVTLGKWFLFLFPLGLKYDNEKPYFAQQLKDWWYFLKDWGEVWKLSKMYFREDKE